MNKETIQSGIYGLTIGDALGVPVEFKTRQELRKNPVTTMIGYGTYLSNCGKRLIVEKLLPNKIRGWVFQKFARE